MKSVEKEETYTVLKPSVQIETASMPALYFKCANRLVTYSPGLGALYSPSFNGSGAEFIPGGSGKVTIVPNSAKVTMDVVNGGITLQSFPFPVRRVPKPTIKMFGNGSAVDERRGASASGLRTLGARAIADESFKATNPEDASFRVAEFEVNLARGTRKIGGGTFNGEANISGLAQQAQTGDRYVIVIKKVERKNFKGEIESVDVGEVFFTIPLN
jgi:gliding motility-associated protein GldM